MSAPRSIPPGDPPMKPTEQFSRRQMLAAGTAATTLTIRAPTRTGWIRSHRADVKLNIAGIGMGGMGTGDVPKCG